ncbi:MAG: peptidylprolyl isomerase [Actinomycetota bacterium]|nr:peptidylprolyl isomerase [Actinomycetota bacterium]
MSRKLKRNIIITSAVVAVLVISALVYFFVFYNKTVAAADGIKVNQKEVDIYMNFLKTQDSSGELPTDEEGLKSLEANIIDSLIVMKLLENYAGENDIEVASEEIDEQMQTASANYSSEEDFENDLKSMGISKKFLEDYLRSQLFSNKIYNTVTADASVTDAEVRQYYDDNKSTQFLVPARMETSHILAMFPWIVDGSEETEVGRDEALSKIKTVQEKLNEGEDFADLAQQYSDDTTSAENGGKLGFISEGQMVDEFDKALFALDVGEVSGIVETEYGFHIIKATGYEEEHIQKFSEVKEAIDTYLLNLQKMEMWEDFIYSLIEKADIKYFTDVEGTLKNTETGTETENDTDAETENDAKTGTEEESE